MVYRLIWSRMVSCGIFAAGTALLISPAVAHTVQVSGDVAGTWHIEPNHTPKAGEPATAWIALTRKGGQLLPLASATCQLAVYEAPRQPNDAPVLEPAVKTIAVERYQGIPGAEISFPQVGIYELEMSCTPKTEGDFQPFQMQYEVTVAEGTAPAAPSAPAVAPQETPADVASQAESSAGAQTANSSNFIWIGLIAAVALGLGSLLVLRKRFKS